MIDKQLTDMNHDELQDRIDILDLLQDSYAENHHGAGLESVEKALKEANSERARRLREAYGNPENNATMDH